MDAAAEGSQVRLDDPAAFRSFYDDALPRIYGYFLHRCGGAVPLAEDLTQETFLAAVRELKKGRAVETPLPWLYGIARHKLLDHYRSRERAERNLAVAWEGAELDDEVLLETAGEEARPLIMTALASVAASQQAALVLRYLDGLSVPEVAAVLGKSVEAVESLLARGRESFKRAYLEAAA